MADTNNTTQPISQRGGLVPVLRYGNFAGPGYAGRLGAETVIAHPDINDGRPIQAATLTQVPKGLVSFSQESGAWIEGTRPEGGTFREVIAGSGMANRLAESANQHQYLETA